MSGLAIMEKPLPSKVTLGGASANMELQNAAALKLLVVRTGPALLEVDATKQLFN